MSDGASQWGETPSWSVSAASGLRRTGETAARRLAYSGAPTVLGDGGEE